MILDYIKKEATLKWTPQNEYVEQLNLNNIDKWIDGNNLTLILFYIAEYTTVGKWTKSRL